ncbi:hypothetical protein FQR65_LT14086 [Abscondita terminalis]|nr:hypothetical protein FQR65_LT14086 [Abscondita terminalis]
MSSTLKLLKGAVPSVVPEQNETIEMHEYVPIEMFHLFPRDAPGPELFEDIEKNENTDFVVDYWYLQLMYPKRMSWILTNNIWKVVNTTDYIIFYIADFSELPRIPVSVKINSRLHVTVTMADRVMDPADLTWILPINGKRKDTIYICETCPNEPGYCFDCAVINHN